MKCTREMATAERMRLKAYEVLAVRSDPASARRIGQQRMHVLAREAESYAHEAYSLARRGLCTLARVELRRARQALIPARRFFKHGPPVRVV